MHQYYRLSNKENVIVGYVHPPPPGQDGTWVMARDPDGRYMVEPITAHVWFDTIDELLVKITKDEIKRHTDRMADIRKIRDIYTPSQPQSHDLHVSSDVVITDGMGG